MEIDEVKEILEEKLVDMGWRFKYWNSDDTFEFRNTGADLTGEKKEELVDQFLEDLKEDTQESFLSGKLCLEKKDGQIIKKNIDEDGEASGDGQILSEEEAKELLKKSLSRIDFDLLPTNRAVLYREEIIDIYTEHVRGLKLVTVNMQGDKMITLTDNGGLQFETK